MHELDWPGFGLEPLDGPKVCISASDRDRSWVDRLQRHLEPIVSRVMTFDYWDKVYFTSDSQRRDMFDRVLAFAAVVVPLVTVDYLASRFVVDEMLPMLMERARRGDLLILPVIVGPSRFERTPLARFPAANSPSSPLTGKSKMEQEAVLANVARSVARYLGASTVGLEGRSVL
ncbi:MAG: toll/interleukin-1 receptor domain-containing protein [Isosphaeraceae bacterium]